MKEPTSFEFYSALYKDYCLYMQSDAYAQKFKQLKDSIEDYKKKHWKHYKCNVASMNYKVKGSINIIEYLRYYR